MIEDAMINEVSISCLLESRFLSFFAVFLFLTVMEYGHPYVVAMYKSGESYFFVLRLLRLIAIPNKATSIM